MSSNEDCELANATFKGLQELIQSNGTYLFPENLKIQIENLSEQFQLKKELQITFCIIFDNLDNKSTLIDALLKEKISDHLRSDHQYLVKSDPSIQQTIIGDENQKLCSITVEKERLKLLNNSNIVLSFENYSQFLEDIKIKNAYKPDVVILVINSPKDLEKDNIQSFFNSIKGQFNDENFIFVLNEGDDSDCTPRVICDVCYPSNIRHLFNGHKLENRGFKISASRCLNVQSKDDSFVVDENYQNLLFVLKKELKINHVMNRFKQQAHNIQKEIDAILKTNKIGKCEILINEYNKKLDEKSSNILRKLDTQQAKSINDVGEMFRNYQNSYSDKKIKLKSYLDENCNKLNENIQNDILNLTEEINLKDCNNIIKSLFENIMYDHGLKEENLKKKAYELFDEFIDNEYPQNVDEENIEEQSNNEGFITSAINVLNGMFAYAKDGFLSFKNTFKTKATSIVDVAKKEIKRSKFNTEFEKFKIHLKNEMKQDMADLFNLLNKVIIKYKIINLFNENNFNWDFISTITNKTIKMRGTIMKIKFFFVMFGKFSNEKCEEFFKNYFPMVDFENFHKDYESSLIELFEKIQDDRYYKIEQKVLRVKQFSFIGAVIDFILSNDKKFQIIETKFLRSFEVLQEIEILRKDFFQETDDIINKMLISMNKFVNLVC